MVCFDANFIQNDVISRAFQTLTGSIVLVINPFKNVHSAQTLDAYGFTSELIELPPHVWSVARDAYMELILNSTLQQQVTSLLSCQLVLCCFYLFYFSCKAIIISGESGGILIIVKCFTNISQRFIT